MRANESHSDELMGVRYVYSVVFLRQMSMRSSLDRCMTHRRLRRARLGSIAGPWAALVLASSIRRDRLIAEPIIPSLGKLYVRRNVFHAAVETSYWSL